MLAHRVLGLAALVHAEPILMSADHGCVMIAPLTGVGQGEITASSTLAECEAATLARSSNIFGQGECSEYFVTHDQPNLARCACCVAGNPAMTTTMPGASWIGDPFETKLNNPIRRQAEMLGGSSDEEGLPRINFKIYKVGLPFPPSQPPGTYWPIGYEMKYDWTLGHDADSSLGWFFEDRVTGAEACAARCDAMPECKSFNFCPGPDQVTKGNCNPHSAAWEHTSFEPCAGNPRFPGCFGCSNYRKRSSPSPPPAVPPPLRDPWGRLQQLPQALQPPQCVVNPASGETVRRPRPPPAPLPTPHRVPPLIPAPARSTACASRRDTASTMITIRWWRA